jgi:Sigma-70 region 2
MRQPTAPAVSDVPDEELLRLIGDGDRDAFVTLYGRYQDVVYGFAYQMCGNQTAAEDITQETFLALARAALRYRASEARFTTYRTAWCGTSRDAGCAATAYSWRSAEEVRIDGARASRWSSSRSWKPRRSSRRSNAFGVLYSVCRPAIAR